MKRAMNSEKVTTDRHGLNVHTGSIDDLKLAKAQFEKEVEANQEKSEQVMRYVIDWAVFCLHLVMSMTRTNQVYFSCTHCVGLFSRWIWAVFILLLKWFKKDNLSNIQYYN